MQNLEQTQNSMQKIITNFKNLFALALITLTGTLTFVACGDDNEEIKKEDATELASAYSFADLNVKRTMALSQLIPIFQNDGLELWQEEDYYEATKYVSYQGTLLKYKVAFSCQDGTNLTNHAIEFWVEDIEKYADAESILKFKLEEEGSFATETATNITVYAPAGTKKFTNKSDATNWFLSQCKATDDDVCKITFSYKNMTTFVRYESLLDKADEIIITYGISD